MENETGRLKGIIVGGHYIVCQNDYVITLKVHTRLPRKLKKQIKNNQK
jgi:rRNA pseudouridine-1189 N-methylase Emg1 (Nep1/Mra1 family)